MNQQTAVIGPRRAVLYMRAAQDSTGSSVARQRELCRAFAAEHGYTVFGAFADIGHAPGATTRPPGYARMVEHATAEAASVVIVADRARISRRCTDYVLLRDELRDLGIAIRSVTDPWLEERSEEIKELLLRIDAHLADADRETGNRHAR